MNSPLQLNRDEAKITLAEAFATAFPVSGDPSFPTEVSADQIDNWAAINGHYKHMGSNPSVHDLNAERGRFKNKLNDAATSTAYINTGASAYRIEVHRHSHIDDITGDRVPTVYAVNPAVVSFTQNSVALTKKVRTVMQERTRQLQILLDRADWQTVSPELKAQAKQQQRSINNWSRRVALDAELLDADFSAFHRDLLEAGIDVHQLISGPDDDPDLVE